MVNQVLAFITPLLVGIGLVGGFIAWVLKKSSEKIRNEINSASTSLSTRLDGTIILFTERFESLQRQLEDHKKAMGEQNSQLTSTALAVAEIKGSLGGQDGHGR